jgi:hypothetical protein
MGDQEAQMSGTTGEKLHEAADTAREKIAAAYSSAQEKASGAGHRVASGIETNPLAALIGGLAIGAAAGALLPGTRREADALGPIGSRLTDAAKLALGAAKEAGKESLSGLGLNQDAARAQIGKLVDAAIKTAETAGTAAAESFKKK